MSPPGPARPRGGRRAVTVLAALALLIGGVGAAWAMSSDDDYTCSDGTVVGDYSSCPSLRTSAPTATYPTKEYTARPTARVTTARAGLAACSLAQSGCSAKVVADSRRVWPTLTATSNCRIDAGFYNSGADRFTVWCTGASGALYGLVWRSASAGYPDVVDLYARWIGASSETFALLGGNDVLGAQVGGSVVADTGDKRYLCVWEYEDYPVAMVIDGPDDDSTPRECSATRFLARPAMASLFG